QAHGDYGRMKAKEPNHRAALDAGSALCYVSGVIGPARVSAWVVRQSRCVMANRTYLINHAERAPVSLDNQQGNWLLAASYQIPSFGWRCSRMPTWRRLRRDCGRQ